MDERLAEGFLLACAEAAAAAAPHVGRGDGHAVDEAAVRALRSALDRLPVDAEVVVGEGEKDDAPMLAPGERLGRRGADAPALDLAIDPVDGTRLAAAGRPGSLVVVSVAPRGALARLGAAHYLEKLATWLPAERQTDASGSGPPAIIERLPWLVGRIAAERRVAAGEVVVAVQDRPRNTPYVEAARAAGARVELFEHGDVERTFRAARRGHGIDVVAGIGGAPEGVLTAVAVRALGGDLRARPAPQSDAEAARVAAAGFGVDAAHVLGLHALCAANAAEVATFCAAVTACDVSVPLPAPGPVDAPAPGGGIRIAVWSTLAPLAPARLRLLDAE
ncbi:fructose-bisphosphatase class II [Agromyces agglutinans]|uniref:fructose-bisphosphatase class II n=1 Tax=Agromyces agglutinans TaxID=2662258 RepID=UPI0012999C0E|nr:fructose-bisphosphatase class II [Agromyces agglutinans]